METLESMDKKVDIHATEDNRVDLKATVDNSREVDLPTNSQPAEREQGADDLLSKSGEVDDTKSGCGEDKVITVPPAARDGNDQLEKEGGEEAICAEEQISSKLKPAVSFEEQLEIRSSGGQITSEEVNLGEKIGEDSMREEAGKLEEKGKNTSAGNIPSSAISSLAVELAQLNQEAERIDLKLSREAKIPENGIEGVESTLEEAKAKMSDTKLEEGRHIVNESLDQLVDVVESLAREKLPTTCSSSESALDAAPPSPSLLASACDEEDDDDVENGVNKTEEGDEQVVEETIVISDTEISDTEDPPKEGIVKPVSEDPLAETLNEHSSEERRETAAAIGGGKMEEKKNKEGGKCYEKSNKEEKGDKKVDNNADDEGEDEVESILPDYYALVCMHVETFKISDSPDVSLTQVYTKIIFGYWHIMHVENHSHPAYLIFFFLLDKEF